MTSRVAAVAVSATLLASCGDDFKPVEKGHDEASKVLAAAPKKTRDAGTARMALSMDFRGRPLFHASGISRLGHGLLRLRIVYDAPSGKIRAGESIDAVVEGEDLYTRLRERGAQWVHTRNDPENPTFFSGAGQSLNYLSAVTGNARRDGFTDVRGTRVRAYTATVDLERVAEALPADQRTAYRRRIGRYGTSRLPVRFGIDEQGRIASMAYQFSVRGQEFGLHAAFYDFGASGDLSVPKHFIEGS